MIIRSVFCGTGSYLPPRAVSNKDLEKIVDTNDEWIVQRTGIKQRYLAEKDQTTSDMAIEAARKAIEASGFDVSTIDCVIVATTTPDQTFPSVAVKVQSALKLPKKMAFDVQAVCSGFVYALTVADNFIRLGQCKRALVIGADKMSSILNWEDRTTCVLFGDGAGAVVLEGRAGKGTTEDRGIHSTHIYSDGDLAGILYTDGGPSSTGTTGQIVMHGKEVFKYAVNYMSQIVQEALEKNNLKPEDIDWLVPHQANLRIITATAEKLNMSMDRVVLTVDKHGNTSAASIPLALDEAVRDGRIKPGHMVLFEALGGGLTWGAAVARF